MTIHSLGSWRRMPGAPGLLLLAVGSHREAGPGHELYDLSTVWSGVAKSSVQFNLQAAAKKQNHEATF
jgi:hypothetical protein